MGAHACVPTAPWALAHFRCRGPAVRASQAFSRGNENGCLEKTPDARVRQVIELMFFKFFELGSARQVVIWMRESRIQAPVNRDRRGHVIWKDVTSDHVYQQRGVPGRGPRPSRHPASPARLYTAAEYTAA
jgi:hypothetical protein